MAAGYIRVQICNLPITTSKNGDGLTIQTHQTVTAQMAIPDFRENYAEYRRLVGLG